MPGRKKKLNAKKKAENQKHLEHRKLKEEEEKSKPKSFNDPGPSSAPGYAKRQDENCSAKNELRNPRVPTANPCDSKDLLASIQEELISLKERMNNIELSKSSGSCEYHSTGLAIASDSKNNEFVTTAIESAPKLEVDNYIRKVALSSREVNQLSRPNHIDLYDLYFRLSASLEYLSNYCVQMLVTKNKSRDRKPFLRKLMRNNINVDLKKILEGLPEYQESHRKPIEIENFQALPEQKKIELRKYIDSLVVPVAPDPPPPNPEYFINAEEGVLTNTEFPNPFMRSAPLIEENVVPVFNMNPEVNDITLPRLTMLAALVGQKKNYKRVRPALTNRLIVDDTPKRFLSKFLNLMTTGFCFLGKIIIQSLSLDEKTNRGNIFQFQDGDVGFWWAGVIILDWNEYLLRNRGQGKHNHKPISCVEYIKTVGEGTVAYRAMLNLGPDGLYFTEQDQKNFQETIEKIKHKRTSPVPPEGINDTVRQLPNMSVYDSL